MKSSDLIIYKKAESLLNDVYPVLRAFPKSEKFSLCQEIKQAFYALLRNIMLANNIKARKRMYQEEVDAYGFKIWTTHKKVRDQSKRAMKRRIKAMDRKVKEGSLTVSEVKQAVNSWLGHARHSNSYNLAKKIFTPYPYIKVEGDEYFGKRRFN